MKKNILHVAKSYLIVVIGTGGARAIAFLTSIVLARSLGPGNFGQFSLFQSAMFICWQVPQAFDTAFIRFAKSEDSKEYINECLAAATRLKIFFSIIAIGLAYPIALFINSLGSTEAKSGFLITAGIVCGVLLSFMSSIANLMRVRESFIKFSIVQGLYNLTVFIFIAFMAYILRVINIQNTLTAVMFIACVYGLGSLCFIYKTSGNPFKAPPEMSRLLFSLVKWILPTVVAFYFFARIDILMLSAFLPFESVGIYSAAGQVILIVSLVIGAASTVFMPRSINAVKSREALVTYVKESIIPLCLIGGSILLLYISAPLIFSLLFTSAYAASVEILRILLVGYIFVGLYIPLSFLFYAIDRPDIRFCLEAGKLVTAIILLYFIIPYGGPKGAAWAMSAAMALNSIISSIVLVIFLKKNLPAAHQGKA